eukprot:869731-Amphidinium_carterae.3
MNKLKLCSVCTGEECRYLDAASLLWLSSQLSQVLVHMWHSRVLRPGSHQLHLEEKGASLELLTRWALNRLAFGCAGGVLCAAAFRLSSQAEAAAESVWTSLMVTVSGWRWHLLAQQAVGPALAHCLQLWTWCAAVAAAGRGMGDAACESSSSEELLRHSSAFGSRGFAALHVNCCGSCASYRLLYIIASASGQRAARIACLTMVEEMSECEA